MKVTKERLREIIQEEIRRETAQVEGKDFNPNPEVNAQAFATGVADAVLAFGPEEVLRIVRGVIKSLPDA
jgi:hypothetical protein